MQRIFDWQRTWGAIRFVFRLHGRGLNRRLASSCGGTRRTDREGLPNYLHAVCDRGGQAIWPAGALLDHVQRADPTYLWLHQALVGAILLYATWSSGKCDV